jgi:hypothetical protein
MPWSICAGCRGVFRVFAGVEGSEDEVELIAEAQVFLTPTIVLKLNNAVGLTSKATDLGTRNRSCVHIPLIVVR